MSDREAYERIARQASRELLERKAVEALIERDKYRAALEAIAADAYRHGEGVTAAMAREALQ